MSFFPDLGTETMVASGPHVRAVGWLAAGRPFPTGEVPSEVASRLRTIAALARESQRELELPLYRGFHTCEFRCGDGQHGWANFGVPAGDVLFVAPEMIAHFVDRHGYSPPAAFLDAVMRCPLPGTPAYRLAVERFLVVETQRTRWVRR